MALDVQVRVTCPDDEESKDESVQAVLRISEIDLALWYPYKHKESESWMRRTLRPFRGPWPIQLLLTPFFAPTILFGKRDVNWIRLNGETPRLRITPFVPPEFWLDIHFACDNDYELVVNSMEALWNPPDDSDRKTSLVLFVRKWWRLSGLAVFIFTLVGMATASHCANNVGSAVLPWVGFAGFFLFVVAIMFVEVFSSRKEHPPQQNRSPE